MLETEAASLESERHGIESALAAARGGVQRPELWVVIGSPMEVEEFGTSDAELRSVAAEAELLAASRLPAGSSYVVQQSREFVWDFPPADVCAWMGWTVHVQAGESHGAALLLRRKFLPDDGARAQV